MKHLSDSSLFSSLFSNFSVAVPQEISPSALHQLHDMLQRTGICHFSFSTKNQREQVFEKLFPLYKHLYAYIDFLDQSNAAWILQSDQQILDEFLLEYTDTGFLFLEAQSHIQAVALFSRLYKTILDLGIKNTISIVIVSHSS